MKSESSSERICAVVRTRFSEFVEGDLAEEARREMETHLATCAACAASLARFREAIDALGRLSRPEPPPDLPDRIDRALDALETRRGPQARARGRGRLVRHAMAALLVAGIVVGIVRVVPEVRGPLPARDAGRPAPGAGEAARTEEGAALDRAAPPPAEKAAPSMQAARAKTADERPAAPERREAAPSSARNEAAPAAGALVAKSLPDLQEQRAARYAGEAAEAPAGAARSVPPPRQAKPEDVADARSLLLAARGDRAWAAAVRDLALARPADLAAAWEGIAPDARAAILEAWRRAEPPAGLRADLSRARSAASTAEEREVIDAFTAALRPASP